MAAPPDFRRAAVQAERRRIHVLTPLIAGSIVLAVYVTPWLIIPWILVDLWVTGWVLDHLEERRRRPRQATGGQLGNSVWLGSTDDGDAALLSYSQLAAHALIVGASGSGKTTSLLKILCEAIMRGLPVVAIDLKGSQSFGDHLWAASQAAQRPFWFWRMEGPWHWNFLQYGDASELKDKLISTERFTEPHYQRAAERYLQMAIQVLQQARPDKPVTLAAVTNVLDPDNFRRLLPHVPRELAQRVGTYLHNLNRDQRSAIMGLQSRLAILSESAPGEFLQPAGPERTIDLHKALNTTGGVVTLFSLNSSRHPKLAAQIAALVIQDLIAVSGYRVQGPARPLALVAVDEFSAIEADNLLGLFARAREPRISVLLSTQELADLERLAAGFEDQVLGNTAVLLAHRQNVPSSAELIARMIGTETVWKATHQLGPPETIGQLLRGGPGPGLTGKGTIREVEEFRIHPNKIKELPTGKAVLITKIPTATARVVNVKRWTPPRANDDGR